MLSRCRLLLSRGCKLRPKIVDGDSGCSDNGLCRSLSSSSTDQTHMGGGVPFSTTGHLPVTVFSEDETMTRDAVRQWARVELLPVVRAMDDDQMLRPEILSSLFSQGLMGMEIDPSYGGSGLSFTSACLAVEEVSRVDPSVAILRKLRHKKYNATRENDISTDCFF
jgi:hypothetical protein